MRSPEPENYLNRNPQRLKFANYFRFVEQTIGDRATTFLSRVQNLVKIGKELWTFFNRTQIRNLHISKIRFLFSVLFTIEHKAGIAEFYPHVRFSADLLKNVVTRA